MTSGNKAGETAYIYYTVKKGDTLWDIANQYKGVSVDDIKKWNNMGSSSKLQVGQKLKIRTRMVKKIIPSLFIFILLHPERIRS